MVQGPVCISRCPHAELRATPPSDIAGPFSGSAKLEKNETGCLSDMNVKLIFKGEVLLYHRNTQSRTEHFCVHLNHQREGKRSLLSFTF